MDPPSRCDYEFLSLAVLLRQIDPKEGVSRQLQIRLAHVLIHNYVKLGFASLCSLNVDLNPVDSLSKIEYSPHGL